MGLCFELLPYSCFYAAQQWVIKDFDDIDNDNGNANGNNSNSDCR